MPDVCGQVSRGRAATSPEGVGALIAAVSPRLGCSERPVPSRWAGGGRRGGFETVLSQVEALVKHLPPWPAAVSRERWPLQPHKRLQL